MTILSSFSLIFASNPSILLPFRQLKGKEEEKVFRKDDSSIITSVARKSLQINLKKKKRVSDLPEL